MSILGSETSRRQAKYEEFHVLNKDMESFKHALERHDYKAASAILKEKFTVIEFYDEYKQRERDEIKRLKNYFKEALEYHLLKDEKTGKTVNLVYCIYNDVPEKELKENEKLIAYLVEQDLMPSPNFDNEMCASNKIYTSIRPDAGLGLFPIFAKKQEFSGYNYTTSIFLEVVVDSIKMYPITELFAEVPSNQKKPQLSKAQNAKKELIENIVSLKRCCQSLDNMKENRDELQLAIMNLKAQIDKSIQNGNLASPSQKTRQAEIQLILGVIKTDEATWTKHKHHPVVRVLLDICLLLMSCTVIGYIAYRSELRKTQSFFYCSGTEGANIINAIKSFTGKIETFEVEDPSAGASESISLDNA